MWAAFKIPIFFLPIYIHEKMKAIIIAILIILALILLAYWATNRFLLVDGLEGRLYQKPGYWGWPEYMEGRLYQKPGYWGWPEYMEGPSDPNRAPEYMEGRLYQRPGYWGWPEYMSIGNIANRDAQLAAKDTNRLPEYLKGHNPFVENDPRAPEAPWHEWFGHGGAQDEPESFLSNPLNQPKKIQYPTFDASRQRAYQFCKCCTPTKRPSFADFLRRLAFGGPSTYLSEKTAGYYPPYLPPMINKGAIRDGGDYLLSTAPLNGQTPPLYTVQILYTKYCDQHPLLFYFEQIARDYLANCKDIESTINFERILIDPLLVTNNGKPSHFPKILKMYRDGTIIEYNGHSTLDELSNFIHDYRPYA
jgi:hypothetical protein